MKKGAARKTNLSTESKAVKKFNLIKCGLVGATVGFLLFFISIFCSESFDNFLNLLIMPSYIFYNFFISNLIFIFTEKVSVLLFYLVSLLVEGFIIGVIAGFLINTIKRR